MFTIEHDYDATIITLIDEPGDRRDPLQEDVTVAAHDDGVVIEQLRAPDSDEVMRITLSLAQLADLRAALGLPEGSYRLRHGQPPEGQGGGAG